MSRREVYRLICRLAEVSLGAFFEGEPEIYSLSDVKVEGVYGLRKRR